MYNATEIIEPGYYSAALSRGSNYDLDGCMAVATAPEIDVDDMPAFDSTPWDEMDFGMEPADEKRTVPADEAHRYCACCDGVDVPHLCTDCMRAELEAEADALSPEDPGFPLGF